MTMEHKEKLAREETDFRNSLLISNPELYLQLFEKPDSPFAKDDERPEWFVPKSEDDVKDILDQLRELGLA